MHLMLIGFLGDGPNMIIQSHKKEHLMVSFGADVHTCDDIQQWCYDTYGNPGERWIDNIHFGQILFDDEKDLSWFLLRWS